MNKILVSLAILSLSTSAALAAKTHHAKKPAASTTAMNPSPFGGAGAAPLGFGQVSSADREMYLRNKRESGVK
jgi:hypothetical protein